MIILSPLVRSGDQKLLFQTRTDLSDLLRKDKKLCFHIPTSNRLRNRVFIIRVVAKTRRPIANYTLQRMEDPPVRRLWLDNAQLCWWWQSHVFEFCAGKYTPFSLSLFLLAKRSDRMVNSHKAWPSAPGFSLLIRSIDKHQRTANVRC